MMAAGTAASLGKDISLFERNAVLGKKILITGGQMNLTNDCTAQESFHGPGMETCMLPCPNLTVPGWFFSILESM